MSGQTICIGLLQKDGIEDGLVLDLGCGTGAMTERMAAYGYDMIGVDQFGGDAGDCHGKTFGVRSRYPVSSAGYAGV